jgi:hypothetical protein
MNNKYLYIGLAVALVAGLVGGILGAKWFAPLVGGDFAGGVLPTNLVTGNDANNYAYPVGSLAWGAPNGLYIGGLAANNELTQLYTATEAYPATAFNLGAITNATSATSTSFSFSAPGFSVGDACEVTYNGATTTSAFGADAFVTAVNGSAVTTTVTFWNGAASAITFSVTSTATGVSSTLKATCFHTGV